MSSFGIFCISLVLVLTICSTPAWSFPKCEPKVIVKKIQVPVPYPVIKKVPVVKEVPVPVKVPVKVPVIVKKGHGGYGGGDFGGGGYGGGFGGGHGGGYDDDHGY